MGRTRSAITKRQLEVLTVISDLIDEKTYSPSYQEIADATGLASMATVAKHVGELHKRDFIVFGFNRSRSIVLTEEGKNLLPAKSDTARFVATSKSLTPEEIAMAAFVQKAQQEMAAAVRQGILIRPDRCSVCDERCTPKGHHDDYARPLKVRWLCSKCHSDVHHRMPKHYLANNYCDVANQAKIE